MPRGLFSEFYSRSDLHRSISHAKVNKTAQFQKDSSQTNAKLSFGTGEFSVHIFFTSGQTITTKKKPTKSMNSHQNAQEYIKGKSPIFIIEK